MQLTQHSAVEMLARLRTGEISPVELADEHIRRIKRLNPQLNALVDFDAKRVHAQARLVKSGPLAGFPVTVKSSIATAGHRCEVGSVLNRGDVLAEDAVVVQRLRRAGTVILGTTNAPEFRVATDRRRTAAGMGGERRRPREDAF